MYYCISFVHYNLSSGAAIALMRAIPLPEQELGVGISCVNYAIKTIVLMLRLKRLNYSNRVNL